MTEPINPKDQRIIAEQLVIAVAEQIVHACWTAKLAACELDRREPEEAS